ncbi:MAG: hypothetical protein ACRDJE_25185 [Dehalococcoidia bacterium]
MAPGDDEITLQLIFDENRRWLTARIDVADDVVLRMIINPGYPISAITQRALHDLLARGFAVPDRVGTYLVQRLQADGQSLPNIGVRVRAALDRFGVDGILGFDFATNFTDVCLNIPARRLTLRP